MAPPEKLELPSLYFGCHPLLAEVTRHYLRDQFKGRFVATECPSEGRWYQHFKTGICSRMGDVVDQDRAYTIEVLLALIEMYEQEWQTYYLQMPLLSISACMFLLVSVLGGMRGYEVLCGLIWQLS